MNLVDVICGKVSSAESKVGEKSRKFNSVDNQSEEARNSRFHGRSVNSLTGGRDFHLQSLKTCHPTESPIRKTLDAVVVERSAEK